MRRNAIQLFILCCLSTQSLSGLAAPFGEPPLPESLHLTGQSWCPYICANKSKPGFVSEYINLMVKDLGYRVSMTLQPYQHAISATKKGNYDALVLAKPEDIEDFLLPVEATISSQFCFYTRAYDLWNYKNENSLTNKKLGGLKTNGYSAPLDSYLKHHPLTISTQPLKSLINRLESKHIDILIEDRYVLLHQLQQMKTKPLREAGCLKPQPYYLALSPKFAERYRVLPRIENWLRQQNSKVLLNGLLAKYHLMP